MPKRDDGITPAALQAALAGDLDNFEVATTPGGIERQEAQEQERLVREVMLPRAVPFFLKHTSEEICNALGIKVLGVVDDLFYRVELPEGWQFKATGHSMWSNVLDAKGRVRLQVFYKGAFYDRKAELYLEPRYRVERGEYADPPIPEVWVRDHATGERLHVTPVQLAGDEKSDGWHDRYRAASDVVERLNRECIPEHDPFRWE